MLADQSNDQKTVVYAGKRDIDSVAVSRNGNVVVFSMRLDSGRRQVFRFTVSSRTLKRLTFHGDDVSVSMSANGRTVVWVRYEDWGCDDGCPSIKIREYSGGSYTQRSIWGGKGASVSGDGNYIVYVTDEDATNFEIWLYNKLNNTRTAVTKPGGFMRYPSVSNGGTKIAYLRNDYGESSPVDYVRVKDLTTGKTRNVVSYRRDRGVYEPIHHPHLTADGNFITYVLNTNDRSNVYTKNLSTGRVALTDTRLLPKRHYAPYWQK
jgi:Tol biopolymer transport system component